MFCIISNNCWGAEVYKDLNIEYNTPFVGLFVPPLCFAKMCNDLPVYLNKQLTFIKESKYSDYKNINYPIGLLGDVELHFMHYHSEEEAIAKWSRRLSRMPSDITTWHVKGDDREILDWDKYRVLWNKISYNKIFFSSQKREDIQNLVWLFEYKNASSVLDGKKLYNISKRYVNISNWIAGKDFSKGMLNIVISNMASTLKSKLRIKK